uniref:Uncharacterized protein n=1 Tax=Lepeophtheirus salmonis TaxID=72036 RepID=A0A0K2UAJ1_LEPSM
MINSFSLFHIGIYVIYLFIINIRLEESLFESVTWTCGLDASVEKRERERSATLVMITY